jgi:hypothetical protein
MATIESGLGSAADQLRKSAVIINTELALDGRRRRLEQAKLDELERELPQVTITPT